MKLFAAVLSAVALTVTVSAAQAETCVIQSGGTKEPSTDDSIGACINNFYILELFNAQTNQMTTVDKIVTTDDVNGQTCVKNKAKESAAEATLRAEANEQLSKGTCDKLEVWL